MMKKYTLYQGNLFDHEVKFTYEDFDFTGAVIECQLRTSALSPAVVYEFAITPDYSVLGEATFRLQISEEDSEDIKIGSYVGDIKIKRESPAYGPYTVASFCLNCVKPVTRDQ